MSELDRGEDSMIRIAVCDDDQEYAKWLEGELYRLSGGGISVTLYSSGEDLLVDADIPYELVILDVEMPGINGTETAFQIRKENRNAILVFISGVKNPTPESFKVAPYRYLLKQFERKQTEMELLEILRETRSVFSDDFLVCTRNGVDIQVRLRNILYLSIARGGCRVHCIQENSQNEGPVMIKKRLWELEESLNDNDFFCAHNSYLVNLSQVASFSKKEVVLKDGTVLTVSRSRYAGFERRLFEFWGRKYR